MSWGFFFFFFFEYGEGKRLGIKKGKRSRHKRLLGKMVEGREKIEEIKLFVREEFA